MDDRTKQGCPVAGHGGTAWPSDHRRQSKPASSCWVKSPLLRRLGAVGFLFFLIKGLAWLVVPAMLAWAATN